MSETEMRGGELGAVLQRIEALVAQNRAAHTSPRIEVPRLTEVYAGPQPSHFFEAEVLELPVLDQQSSPVPRQDDAQRRQRLLEAMRPVIEAAVQSALQDALETLEKNLRARLEREMLAALQVRLETELP